MFSANVLPIKPTSKARNVTFLALIALLLPIGCAQDRGPAEVRDISVEEPLNVVATTSMIADLSTQIGGDLVSVQGLMGPGIDPHLYKASEGDVAAMTNAEMILYNGLHLEGKMVDIFSQMQQRCLPVYAITDGLDDSDLLTSEYFVGSQDPHIWFDISLWKKAAQRIRDVLSQAVPNSASLFNERTESYISELDSLDTWTRLQIASIPVETRVLITSHDAFGYFGRAYGIDVKGLQGISTASEAGTGDVRDLASFVAENEIPSMFVESSISPRGIEAVREAVRARGFEVAIGGTLFGDALGSPGTEAGTYLGMFRENVTMIVAGLGGGQ